jgi:hypothetical protein
MEKKRVTKKSNLQLAEEESEREKDNNLTQTQH